jgi:hypothetical protein
MNCPGKLSCLLTFWAKSIFCIEWRTLQSTSAEDLIEEHPSAYPTQMKTNRHAREANIDTAGINNMIQIQKKAHTTSWQLQL